MHISWGVNFIKEMCKIRGTQLNASYTNRTHPPNRSLETPQSPFPSLRAPQGSQWTVFSFVWRVTGCPVVPGFGLRGTVCVRFTGIVAACADRAEGSALWICTVVCLSVPLFAVVCLSVPLFAVWANRVVLVVTFLNMLYFILLRYNKVQKL